MPSPSDLVTADDHALARRLAVEAGALLVELRAELADAGAEPAEIKAQGDARSNEFLLAELAGAIGPDDAVLSEEARDTHGDDARLAARRVWIIDPLDGTREFSEPPRDDWAVHVALCVDGEAVCGAVALPALDLVLSTGDDAVDLPAIPEMPRVIVSRTRPPAEAEQVRAAIDGTLVEMGSAGAKTMAVVRGIAECYPHSGGQYEWDSAAPVAVARHYGLHASRLDGSPLRYNNADPYLPDLMISRREFADAALDAVRAV